jgi:MYXO-CTERM domain-containing protein
MTRILAASLTAFALCSAVAAPALAREGDKEACIGLAEGDECTRADGDPGFCFPDDSDPNVLECDDDGSGSASDDGCSMAAGGASPWSLAAAAAALGLVGLRSRRRRAR